LPTNAHKCAQMGGLELQVPLVLVFLGVSLFGDDESIERCICGDLCTFVGRSRRLGLLVFAVRDVQAVLGRDVGRDEGWRAWPQRARLDWGCF
jgi:hypothetical protein